MKSHISIIVLVAGILVVFSVTAHAGLMIQDPGQGLFSIANAGSTGLSGITHIGGDQYLAVSDNQTGFYPLTIGVISGTGAISTAFVGSFTDFPDGPGDKENEDRDYEGIAYNPANARVFASSELYHRVDEFMVSDGTFVGSVSVPVVFNNARSNKSLESLTYDAVQQVLWTANEEALTTDGSASSAGSGTIVRLQKFGVSLNPAGQWAYVVDPGTQDIPPFASFSGLADLLALPNGQLLGLEREFGGPIPGIRNRIYAIDFDGATDTTALAGLEGESVTPVGKTLLWEGNSADNFEGITLGPSVGTCTYSLLLISDDGSNQSGESLYALTLSGANLGLDPSAVDDLQDAILALKVLSGVDVSGAITTDYVSDTDVNCDGQVGIAEVQYILQVVSGLRIAP